MTSTGPATIYRPRVPRDQPLYGANFGEAVGRFWGKYATFSGRASLSEYWWAFLFVVLLSWVPILNLAMIIPAIAVAVRRLHDTDRSGVYYLFVLIPLVGSIIVIVLLAGAPVASGARYDAAARYGYRAPGAPLPPGPSQ